MAGASQHASSLDAALAGFIQSQKIEHHAAYGGEVASAVSDSRATDRGQHFVQHLDKPVLLIVNDLGNTHFSSRQHP